MTEPKRDIAADLAMCETATEGPWTAEEGKPECGDRRPFVVFSPAEHWSIGGWIFADVAGGNDARFIAEARSALPNYIKRTQEAEAEVERLSQNWKTLSDHLHEQFKTTEDLRLRSYIQDILFYMDGLNRD